MSEKNPTFSQQLDEVEFLMEIETDEQLEVAQKMQKELTRVFRMNKMRRIKGGYSEDKES